MRYYCPRCQVTANYKLVRITSVGSVYAHQCGHEVLVKVPSTQEEKK